MIQYKIAKIKKILRHELDKERYEHTLGVMYTASSLAMAHNCNIHKALVAGLLHDCAKCISGDAKIKLCQNDPSLSSVSLYIILDFWSFCKSKGQFPFSVSAQLTKPSLI